MGSQFVPRSPRVRIRRTTDQNITSGDYLTFSSNASQTGDKHVYNDYGMYDSTVNADRIVINQPGVYLITLSASWGPGDGTGYRQFRLYHEATYVATNIVEYVAASGNSTIMNMSYMGVSSANSYYRVQALHTFGGTTPISGDRVYFGATYIRPRA